MSNISIVTAFFDIGRGNWTPDRGLPHYLHRSTDVYIERFSYLLELDTDIVVYTSSDLVDRLTQLAIDKPAKLTVISVDLTDFENIRQAICAVQFSDYFLDRIDPAQKLNPEYWNADYVLVTNLKAYFVDQAIQQDLPERDMVAWIDFGYCRDSSKIPSSASWNFTFDPTKIHLFSYKSYDDKNVLDIIANNDVYILGAKVVAHKSLWSPLSKMMKSSQDLLFANGFVDDDQGLWLISSLMQPELFELHTIPDHQLGHDPFVLFNKFNDTL
jgi:protein YibB